MTNLNGQSMNISRKIAASSIVAASVRDHLMPTLGFSGYCSPPIPMFVGENLYYGFLIGRGEVTSKADGYQIWAPGQLALYDVVLGRMAEIRRIETKNAESTGDAAGPVQRGWSPVEKAAAEYVSVQIRYFECLDELLGQYFDRQDWHPALNICETSFKSISETSLHLYYDRLVMTNMLVRD